MNTGRIIVVVVTSAAFALTMYLLMNYPVRWFGDWYNGTAASWIITPVVGIVLIGWLVREILRMNSDNQRRGPKDR